MVNRIGERRYKQAGRAEWNPDERKIDSAIKKDRRAAF